MLRVIFVAAGMENLGQGLLVAFVVWDSGDIDSERFSFLVIGLD